MIRTIVSFLFINLNIIFFFKYYIITTYQWVGGRGSVSYNKRQGFKFFKTRTAPIWLNSFESIVYTYLIVSIDTLRTKITLISWFWDKPIWSDSFQSIDAYWIFSINILKTEISLISWFWDKFFKTEMNMGSTTKIQYKFRLGLGLY